VFGLLGKIMRIRIKITLSGCLKLVEMGIHPHSSSTKPPGPEKSRRLLGKVMRTNVIEHLQTCTFHKSGQFQRAEPANRRASRSDDLVNSKKSGHGVSLLTDSICDGVCTNCLNA